MAFKRFNRTVFLTISGAVLVVALACGIYLAWNRPEPDEILFNDYLRNQQYQSARELVDRRLKMSSNDPLAYFLKARLELALDEPGPAMEAIQKSFELGYPRESVEVLRALLLARAGQLPEAESILLPAWRSRSGPTAEIAEGLTLVFLGQLQVSEASQMLEQWKKASPLDDRPYLLANEIDERLNAEPSVLIRNYEQALQRKPSNTKARIALAQLLIKANRIEDSLREWERCQTEEPQNIEIIMGLAQIAQLQGDSEKASQLFHEVLQIEPESITALSELAQIEIQSNHLDSAITHLRTAITVSPFDSELFYKLSQALKLSGQAEEARLMLEKSNAMKVDEKHIQDLRKTLVLEPENIAARVEVAQWLMSRGHEKEGLEWAELVLKKQPGHVGMCQFLAQYYEKKMQHGLANYYKTMLPPDLK